MRSRCEFPSLFRLFERNGWPPVRRASVTGEGQGAARPPQKQNRRSGWRVLWIGGKDTPPHATLYAMLATKRPCTRVNASWWALMPRAIKVHVLALLDTRTVCRFEGVSREKEELIEATAKEMCRARHGVRVRASQLTWKQCLLSEAWHHVWGLLLLVLCR